MPTEALRRRYCQRVEAARKRNLEKQRKRPLRKVVSIGRCREVFDQLHSDLPQRTGPPCRSLKPFLLIPLHLLHSGLSQLGEEGKCLFKGFVMGPTIPLDQGLDAVEEVLNLVPALGLTKMAFYIFRSEFNRAFFGHFAT